MEITPYRRNAFFYETDAMGCVHHANFIRWFEETRTYYMEKMGFGYQKSVENGIDLALTGLSCQYRAMVYFNDTVTIELALPQITPSRLTCAYTVADAETGALRATGETHHCYFHNEKRRPVSLKKQLPELYDIFLAFAGETKG